MVSGEREWNIFLPPIVWTTYPEVSVEKWELGHLRAGRRHQEGKALGSPSDGIYWKLCLAAPTQHFLQICGPFFTSVYWGAVPIGPYVDLKYWQCVGPLWSFLGGLVYHGCTVLFSKTRKMLSQSNVKNGIWRSVARKRSSLYNWLEPFHLMQTHYWCNHWVLVFDAAKAFLNLFLHWQSWY